MNPNAFQGTLHPNPSDFTMEVDRLIIREDSIVFDVHGIQDGECWSVESGQLVKEAGRYYGSGCYEGGSKWRVWLLDVSRTEGECSIEGLWFDHEDDGDPSGGWLWTFGGTLQALEGDQ